MQEHSAHKLVLDKKTIWVKFKEYIIVTCWVKFKEYIIVTCEAMN
jgi:hypothetical protein